MVEFEDEKGEEKWGEYEKSGEVKVVAKFVSGMSL